MELNPEIYNRLIDPLLRSIRVRMTNRVKGSNKVLDIACGTGELARSMINHCENVTGIDLDRRMIEFAESRNSPGDRRFRFLVADAGSLEMFADDEFDFSTFSLALHQFYPPDIGAVLSEAARVSEKIVISDYSYPLPGGIKKILLHIVERIAGRQHYRNFRWFLDQGGIPGIAKSFGFDVLDNEISGSGAFTLYVLKRQNS